MFTIISGTKALIKRLKPNAVPSVFLHKPPKKPNHQAISRHIRYEERCQKKEPTQGSCSADDIIMENDICVGADCAIEEEEEEFEDNSSMDCAVELKQFAVSSTQTAPCVPSMSAANFKTDPEGLNYYSGLEDYDKFKFVLQTLGQAAYHLNYYYCRVEQISVEDQFFMTLVKLRRKKTNFELSRLFGTSEYMVTNIFVTWINFMYRQWNELQIWPERDLVRYYAPTDFKAKFPTTRAITDGTEIPIQKPKDPVAQQQSFSHYKNKNTAKVLVSATPGGLVSHVTTSYGGAASDRQIVERSNLMTICDPKDSVMADKGFNVQDLFAQYDVQINIPEFFKKKNRMSGQSVMKDRKIASKRVHIERIIGLGKTFKILKGNLNATETKMASKIIFVCYMLCNFKRNIVPGYA